MDGASRYEEERRRERRRRWLAVGLATVLAVASQVVFLYALVVAGGDEVRFAGALLGIGLGLVPGVMAVAAFASRHPRWLAATLGGFVLFMAVAIPLGVINLPAALVAGYGAGAVVTLRSERPPHTWTSRIVAVALAVAYTVSLQAVWPEVGLFAGAALPFIAVTLADIVRERAADR